MKKLYNFRIPNTPIVLSRKQLERYINHTQLIEHIDNIPIKDYNIIYFKSFNCIRINGFEINTSENSYLKIPVNNLYHSIKDAYYRANINIDGKDKENKVIPIIFSHDYKIIAGNWSTEDQLPYNSIVGIQSWNCENNPTIIENISIEYTSDCIENDPIFDNFMLID